MSRRGCTRRLFYCPKNGKEVWNLWYSKSHRSSELKSMPLFAGLAVTISRVTACYLMTVKKQNACSSFQGTVSTATIFWKQFYRLKKNCMRKSYSKTGSPDNHPKKALSEIFLKCAMRRKGIKLWNRLEKQKLSVSITDTAIWRQPTTASKPAYRKNPPP